MSQRSRSSSSSSSSAGRRASVYTQPQHRSYQESAQASRSSAPQHQVPKQRTTKHAKQGVYAHQLSKAPTTAKVNAWGKAVAGTSSMWQASSGSSRASRSTATHSGRYVVQQNASGTTSKYPRSTAGTMSAAELAFASMSDSRPASAAAVTEMKQPSSTSATRAPSAKAAVEQNAPSSAAAVRAARTASSAVAEQRYQSSASAVKAPPSTSVPDARSYMAASSSKYGASTSAAAVPSSAYASAAVAGTSTLASAYAGTNVSSTPASKPSASSSAQTAGVSAAATASGSSSTTAVEATPSATGTTADAKPQTTPPAAGSTSPTAPPAADAAASSTAGPSSTDAQRSPKGTAQYPSSTGAQRSPRSETKSSAAAPAATSSTSTAPPAAEASTATAQAAPGSSSSAVPPATEAGANAAPPQTSGPTTASPASEASSSGMPPAAGTSSLTAPSATDASSSSAQQAAEASSANAAPTADAAPTAQPAAEATALPAAEAAVSSSGAGAVDTTPGSGTAVTDAAAGGAPAAVEATVDAAKSPILSDGQSPAQDPGLMSPIVDAAAAVEEAGPPPEKVMPPSPVDDNVSSATISEGDAMSSSSSTPAPKKLVRDRCIGIDLGTTYSCVAVLQHGKVEIVANEGGNRTTASYVAFTNNERIIGDMAKLHAASNPTNTVFDAKRLIGRRIDDPTVQADMQHWPFELAEEAGRAKIRVDFKGERKSFYPEEISAMILLKMKETAEAYLGQPVTKAVVTVPAYFNDAQRQATKDAGTIAGLEVLRIINEPTAAAIAYGLDSKKSRLCTELNVLVFDLGGGTFDVSILSLEQGLFEVKATAGDTHLGGEDFNNRLVNHFVEEFRQKYDKDMTTDKRAMCRLRVACERAKRTLSSATKAEIELDSLYDGLDFHSTITRARFEELCNDLFLKTIDLMKAAMADAKLDRFQIDDVILVGGSTRIPKVQKLLETFFHPDQLNRSINPDEAVAYGAAIQAAVLTHHPSDLFRDMLLVDVVPLSLGVELDGGEMAVLIRRNSAIPTKRTEEFNTCEDNQTEVSIRVYEGERALVKDNNLLGEFDLIGLPPAPAQAVKIEVTFDIDANGILNVFAVNKSTGTRKAITIHNERGRLPPEEIERLVREAEEFKDEDRKHKARLAAKNDFERYCAGVRAALEGPYRDKIPESDCKLLETKLTEMYEWLEDHALAEKEEYIEYKHALEHVAGPIMLRLVKGDQEDTKDNQEKGQDQLDRSGEQENMSDQETEEDCSSCDEYSCTSTDIDDHEAEPKQAQDEEIISEQRDCGDHVTVINERTKDRNSSEFDAIATKT